MYTKTRVEERDRPHYVCLACNGGGKIPIFTLNKAIGNRHEARYISIKCRECRGTGVRFQSN